jgi:gas vesicle protein
MIFLSGVAVGAVAGILLAPDSGKNTRDKLSFQIEKQIEQLKLLLAGATKNSPQATHRSDTQNQDYRKAEELLREVENLLEDVKSKSV